VFADLGLPDAAERQAKLRLAYALNQVLEERKLAQADAAKVLGVTQPKVSALRHYKLAGFSVERLMNLLTALDQDVEIVIRRKPRSRKAGRISVVADPRGMGKAVRISGYEEWTIGPDNLIAASKGHFDEAA
jgi:predicted XRE-type DNA-binding protein